MAGELVETTKLYARTCAGIQPQWIERAAAHLVERTYSEPRWDARTASVLATEKVTLHGLVIIPGRTVPYAPINPRQARELFIHHALVLGEWLPPHTLAPFVRHNARLVEEVQLLEAKIRQRNLLADAATRFTFYDARMPLDVTNGAQFETWRRPAENPPRAIRVFSSWTRPTCCARCPGDHAGELSRSPFKHPARSGPSAFAPDISVCAGGRRRRPDAGGAGGGGGAASAAALRVAGSGNAGG